MDAFENLVSYLLERRGYWIRTSFKVELTKAEKRRIGRHSSPRWEIDVLAYNVRENTLLVIECKSYLNSPGVKYEHFIAPKNGDVSRYKLFVEPVLRRVVLNRLANQLISMGACRPSPRVILCLAAGHIASESDRERIVKHFHKRQWQLWDERWFTECLLKLRDSGYENDIPSVVVKLLHSAEAARPTMT